MKKNPFIRASIERALNVGTLAKILSAKSLKKFALFKKFSYVSASF